MAQRWPSASRPARDARMPRAPARGTPAVSAPEACRSTRPSPHAQNFCCLLMARPDDRQKILREQTVTTATEKLESMIEAIEAVQCIDKTLAPARPAPKPKYCGIEVGVTCSYGCKTHTLRSGKATEGIYQV